jgi:copper(I)-binding protein
MKTVPLILAATVAVLLAGCGERVDTGRALYAQHGCAACHGAAGRGDGPSARALAVKPRDLANTGTYRFGFTKSDIARTISEGVPQSAMPAFGHLPAEEREAIASYIVSLQQPPRLEVRDGWAAAAIGNRDSSAAYLIIVNRGEATQLVAARSADVEAIELHAMSMNGAMMRMKKLDRVPLPKGEAVKFAPGGLHLMLFGTKRPLRAGESLRLELQLADGSSQEATIPVRAREESE